jgi:hypothetical protein
LKHLAICMATNSESQVPTTVYSTEYSTVTTSAWCDWQTDYVTTTVYQPTTVYTTEYASKTWGDWN